MCGGLLLTWTQYLKAKPHLNNNTLNQQANMVNALDPGVVMTSTLRPLEHIEHVTARTNLFILLQRTCLILDSYILLL